MPRNTTTGKSRGADGSGSLRKKTIKRGSKTYQYWEGRVTTGIDLGTGKQIQKSVTGKTQKEVRQKMSQMACEVDEGSYIEPTKQTLGEWLDVWLDTYVKDSVAAYTENSYRGYCTNHIKPALGKVKLSALTAPMIQQFYNQLVREKKLTPKSVKNVHGALHRALKQAVRIGLIRTNFTEACDLPKAARKEIVPLEREDVARFLKAISGHKFENFYVVTLFTGMRESEALGLTWDCVDFERDTLYINKQLQKTKRTNGQYALVPTKTGRSRLVPVAKSVMQVLRKVKSQQAQMQLLAGPKWENEKQLVFTNEVGGHLTQVTVYNHFKRIVRELGMEHVRLHDLRHTYAVASLENGDDIKTVQTNLGHATAAFTLDVYAHTTQKMRQQSADRMDEYFRAVSNGDIQ